jgi:integrase
MTTRPVKRITVTKRYQNRSWTLLFRGIPLEIKPSGRHTHSLKLRRKKEDAATAEDILTVVKAELALGRRFWDLSCFKNTTENAAADALLVDQLAQRYFEDRARSARLVDTTLYKTQNVYQKWIGPLLGQREATSVEPGDVITLINTVTKAGKALSYAALIVRRFSSIYSWGITALKLKDSSGRRLLNPCIDPGLREYLTADKEKRRGGTKRKRAFSEEEEKAFLAKVRELYGYESWFFWLTMFRTGLRVGECIALELSDFKRPASPDPILHVHQTWTQKGRHEQRKNVRDLYIHLGLFPSYVEEARRFVEHRQQQNKERRLVLPWVFARPLADAMAAGNRKRRTDCPIAYPTVCGQFHGAMKAAELPRHTPHDTRHTLAVNLLDWTGNVRLVAAYLGDTVQTVVRHYMDPDNEVPWKEFLGVGDRIRTAGGESPAMTPV